MSTEELENKLDELYDKRNKIEEQCNDCKVQKQLNDIDEEIAKLEDELYTDDDNDEEDEDYIDDDDDE